MIRIDTRQFSKTLAQYMQHSKRDIAEVINQKAFFVARGAVRETAKADVAALTRELKQNGLAAKILRAKYARENWPQPKQSEIEQKVETFIAARKRSVNFLKAGWIPAIKVFERALNRSYSQKPMLRAHYPIGGGSAARPGWVAVAELFNAAVSRFGGATGENALSKFATEGLQKAMAKEVASMQADIERKLQGTSNKYSSKTI